MNWPLLKPDFIKHHPPQKDWFQKYQAQYSWNAHLLPIYQWEEILYVVTDTPEIFGSNGPTELPKHWFLMSATPEMMQSIWRLYTLAPSLTAPAPAELDLMAGFPDLPETTPTSENGDEDLELPPPPMDELLDLPGLSSEAVPPLISLNIKSEKATPSLELPRVDESLKNELPPLPLNENDYISDELTPAPEFRPPLPKIKTEGSKSVAKMEITPNQERLILDGLPEMFKASFLATKAGNSIEIRSWPRTTKTSDSTEYNFSLNTPSPFRVALRTEKPYHGYTIQTPFLTEFFKQWNSGHYPDCLTVMPVIYEQKIEGFIISIGNSEAKNRIALSHIERAVQDIEELWPQILSDVAKAS